MLCNRSPNVERSLAEISTAPYLLLNACASIEQKQCPAGTQNLPDCPPLNAVNDEKINKLYRMRSWIADTDLHIDPIKLGAEAEIPINSAATKILGPSHEDALDSLALKIWMIEQNLFQ